MLENAKIRKSFKCKNKIEQDEWAIDGMGIEYYKFLVPLHESKGQ